MSQYSDYQGRSTEQSLQNRQNRNSSMLRDTTTQDALRKITEEKVNDISKGYQRVADAVEKRAALEEEMVKESEASLKVLKQGKEKLSQSLANIEQSLEVNKSNIDEYDKKIKNLERKYYRTGSEEDREKLLEARTTKNKLLNERVALNEELHNTRTAQTNLDESITTAEENNGVFSTNPLASLVSGMPKTMLEGVAGIILTAVGSYLGIEITRHMFKNLSLFGSDGSESGSGGSGVNEKSTLGEFVSGLAKSINTLLNSMFAELNKSVDTAVDFYAANMGKVNARLYGDVEGTNFQSIIEEVRSATAGSMVVNQNTLLNRIVDLSQRGIDYNLEQRALLATLSEDLVPTFDAVNDTLSRMIRLQQADTTLAQMGAEAQLQQLLNSQFKDSSYLNSDGMYDSVYSAIQNALSTQLDTDQATQFGYSIQKWLGGLYSVGLSSEAISSFANAINLLATGDVNKLTDNSAQTLLAMVANRAGLSYASLLTEGLTADTTNDLMKSMVEYLQDIASNTSNNVVKAQWGDILNLQMSDWKAIMNLTETDISNLYNSVTSQQISQDKISTLIETELSTRIHASEMINNALENTMLTFGLGIADDTERYAKWKLLNTAGSLASSLTGDDSTVGTMLNLFSNAATFAEFSKDILGIPAALFNMLLTGDNAIGTLMSGYQFTLDRGNMAIDTSSGVSRTTSQSSNFISLDDFQTDEQEALTAWADLNKNGFESELATIYGTTGTGLNDAEREMITTSAADTALTTFQQQDEYQSATAQNVISQEAVLVRDINDLYSELFEKQTTPIRVSLAQIEDLGRGDIRAAVDGITVNVAGDDVFGGISSMRG